MSRAETALKYFREQKAFTDVRVKSGIELYRKGNAEITFTSKTGELPKDITVEVRQKDHEFKFGCNLFMLDEMESDEKNTLYRQKFPECFNLATVPFYWSDLEPEQGHPRFDVDSPKIYRRPATDLCVNYCKENGIEPKCHCLNYDTFSPDWYQNKNVTQQKALLEKRFREIADRYAKDIPSFEVTNETLQGTTSYRQQSSFFHEDDFVEWSFRMADRYFPNNRLIINDYNIWAPETYNNRLFYYMQIERLLRNGIHHIDSIGMQFHSFFPLSLEAENAARVYNPENLYRLMDTYGKLGLAEQITEMTLSAYSDSEEDEAAQAEILKNMYSIFFSHPAMEAVIYWNLVDGYAAFAPKGDMTAGENKFYGGLLHFDMSEKPAYKMLKHLINEEWHTSEVVKANGNTAKFRGFYGQYDLIIHANGKTIPVPFQLSKKANNKITIEL